MKMTSPWEPVLLFKGRAGGGEHTKVKKLNPPENRDERARQKKSERGQKKD